MRPRVSAFVAQIPNLLSLYRILAVPVLLGMIVLDRPRLFMWLLLISLLTDILDGIIARGLKLESPLGARLDSIGDMFTFGVAMLGVFVFQKAFLSDYGVYVLLILALYLLETLLSLIRFRAISSFHTYLAKLAANLQGGFVLVLFAFGYQAWLFWPTVLIRLLTYVEEILILFTLDTLKSDVRGYYWVLRERQSGRDGSAG